LLDSDVQIALFAAFGGIAVIAALAAVLTRYLLRSIVAFGAFLTAIAGQFYILAADFVALIQIFVYVGGVVVLILFALMLSAVGQKHPLAVSEHRGLGAVVAYAVGGWLVWAAFGQDLPKAGQVPGETVAFLGRAFLDQQLVAFEVIGIILLAAVVAALVIVRGERL